MTFSIFKRPFFLRSPVSSSDILGSGSKTTPISGSGRKKRRRRGSTTKGEKPRQLFSPPTSPNPNLISKQSCNSAENLDRVVADSVPEKSDNDNHALQHQESSQRQEESVTNGMAENAVKPGTGCGHNAVSPVLPNKGETPTKKSPHPWGQKTNRLGVIVSCDFCRTCIHVHVI